MDTMFNFGTKRFQADSFTDFFSEAMTIIKLLQIFALWKVVIASVCDIIWISRNKCVFEGHSASFNSAKASLKVAIREAGKLNLGWIRNNIEDCEIINRLGVESRYPKSSSIMKI